MKKLKWFHMFKILIFLNNQNKKRREAHLKNRKYGIYTNCYHCNLWRVFVYWFKDRKLIIDLLENEANSIII